MSETDTAAPIELLTFQLAKQEYSIDIMLVREIRGWTRATPLPHAPAFMKGVINLRGTVLAIMDLAERLGLPPRENTERNVIIVVKLGDAMTGLLVDAVSDIITVMTDDLQPAPDMSVAATSNVVKALTLIDDRLIRIIDVATLMAPPEGAAA